MSQQFIVGFGEALVDVLPSGEVVGGAPLNFAVRAAELCKIVPQQAALVTRLGADSRGEQILSRLRQTDLELENVQVDSQLQTGFVDVQLHNGQPDYTIGDNVAWDAITWDPQVAQLAQRAACVCFGTLAQRHQASCLTLHRFLEYAPSEAIRILDINVRKPYPTTDTVENSLRMANVLKCNEEELHKLADWLALTSTSPVDIAAELQDRYELLSVFWTRGAEGCCWQQGQELTDAPVPKLPAAADADSVGAGDAASAALAIGATNHWSPQRIVAAANLCGSFAASGRGPTVPMPNELLERIKSLPT